MSGQYEALRGVCMRVSRFLYAHMNSSLPGTSQERSSLRIKSYKSYSDSW